MDNVRRELTEEELNALNGGAFWQSHIYDEGDYRSAGINANFSNGVFKKDSFKVKNVKINDLMANYMVIFMEKNGRKMTDQEFLDCWGALTNNPNSSDNGWDFDGAVGWRKGTFNRTKNFMD